MASTTVPQRYLSVNQSFALLRCTKAGPRMENRVSQTIHPNITTRGPWLGVILFTNNANAGIAAAMLTNMVITRFL